MHLLNEKELINVAGGSIESFFQTIYKYYKVIKIRILMEKTIDSELLKREPSIILENMDITEKVMYLDYLMESKDTKEKELKNAVSFEEILKREGLTIDDLQDKD